MTISLHGELKIGRHHHLPGRLVRRAGFLRFATNNFGSTQTSFVIYLSMQDELSIRPFDFTHTTITKSPIFIETLQRVLGVRFFVKFQIFLNCLSICDQ